jgi:hypothetical protein
VSFLYHSPGISRAMLQRSASSTCSTRDEPFRDLDHPDLGHGQAEHGAELASQVVVYEDADILRVVLELRDVVMVIGRAHEVGL